MLMLIDKGGNEEDFKANLNTSHVNVNRFMIIKGINEKGFKYISC